MAIINNQQTASVGEVVEKSEHLCTVGGNEDWCRHCGSILKKLKMKTSYDPVIPFLEMYLKECETLIQKNIYALKFTAALFTVAKIWKQPKCPSANKAIKKLWYICKVEYYSAVKKKEILLFVTAWMDLESIMLSEISQSENDKYHMISLICGL